MVIRARRRGRDPSTEDGQSHALESACPHGSHEWPLTRIAGKAQPARAGRRMSGQGRDSSTRCSISITTICETCRESVKSKRKPHLWQHKLKRSLSRGMLACRPVHDTCAVSVAGEASGRVWGRSATCCALARTATSLSDFATAFEPFCLTLLVRRLTSLAGSVRRRPTATSQRFGGSDCAAAAAASPTSSSGVNRRRDWPTIRRHEFCRR